MTPTELLAKIQPGVCAALWTPRPTIETLTPNVIRILFETKPQIVCVHGTPDSLVIAAKRVWQQLFEIITKQGVNWSPRLWIGVACDTPIAMAAYGHHSPTAAVDTLARASDVAAEMSAELILWNAEPACKINPPSASAVARALVQRTRQKYPELVQAHSAYGRPTVHAETDHKGHALPHGYPWSAWYDEGGVDVALPQNYAAPEAPEKGPRPMAARGALKTRLLRDSESWEEAVHRGWIRRDLVKWPYMQLHHVPFAQMATYGTDPQKVFKPGPESSLGHVWAGWTVEKDRCDRDGERALRISAELYRRGQSVSVFQASAGISVDGVAGPETEAALFPATSDV